jgi:hypothetical protein
MTNLSAYRRVVDGMWSDPELTGDLLAIGLYWAQALHLSDGGPPATLSSLSTAQAVYGHVNDQTWQAMRGTLLKDARRYDPFTDPRNQLFWSGACQAPMIRRNGLCGKPGNRTHGTVVRDLETGERIYPPRCPRHIQWAEQTARTNKAAWDALAGPDGPGQPIPPANTGGVLRRHLPELDWPAYWTALDPRWVEPPERVPFVRPTFTVLITDDVEPAPAGPRPSLSLVLAAPPEER